MTAEEILKKHCSSSYFMDKRYKNVKWVKKSVLEAMEEYASQQREEGIREGFEAARENIRVEDDFTDIFNKPYKSKYPTADDYLNSK